MNIKIFNGQEKELEKKLGNNKNCVLVEAYINE